MQVYTFYCKENTPAFGRFQQLRLLHHPNLCQYLDLSRRDLKLYLVQELYPDITGLDWIGQLCDSVCYLLEHGVIPVLKASDLKMSNGQLKIMNWGMYYLTRNQLHLVGDYRFYSPELISSADSNYPVWMIGMLILHHVKPWEGELDLTSHLSDTDPDLRDFIQYCLQPLDKRPSIYQLFTHPYLKGFERPHLYCKIPKPLKLDKTITADEWFYYWRLSNDLEAIVNQRHLEPIITNIHPRSVEILKEHNQSLIPLPMDKTLQIIEPFLQDPNANGPIYNDQWKYVFKWTRDKLYSVWDNSKPQMTSSLTKERDIRYQFKRIQKFKHLLFSFPHSYGQLKIESVLDIPPFVRGQVWACLLNVRGDPKIFYDMYDKESPHEIDKQLEMDIPRCHQYHPLLSSDLGHQKLKRVLKAWVRAETGKLVYWQGLDSLCAPFVSLNFNNEALAFCSMQQFINHFCPGFFVADNSFVMREYVLVFRYILSFHDPELASFLYHIGLGPELYAISWFMTFFAHIFPLDKIYILWDHFLTGAPYLFLYLGVAILQQLREQLLQSDFSTAMLVFSDLPEIHVERAIGECIHMAKITPPSLLLKLNQIDQLLSNQSPESVKRFSFLSTKTGIIGSIEMQDYEQMKDMTLVIDVRDQETFKLGHLYGSVLLQSDKQQTIPFGLKIMLSRVRYTLVLVSEQAEKFATVLVKEKQAYVALLDCTEMQCTCQPVPIGVGSQGLFRCSLAELSQQ
ncbi:rab-GTPase-TBC domain-containing protein [Gorgonomyces haynaldii]|nr:rab-GTPase-TBC domain-containing protein [Gorgonomyces haynaldii]